MTNKTRLSAALLAALFFTWTSGSGQTPTAIPVAPLPTKTLLIVGDIGQDGMTEGVEKTGALMEAEYQKDPANTRIVLVGDICDGMDKCHEDLKRTSWGRVLPITYSVPGNHDYDQVRGTAGTPVFWSHMLNTGERDRGWQAFDWNWRVVLLNTEVMGRNAERQLSPLGLEQMAWFQRELRLNAPSRRVLTVYHRPAYSSGRFASPRAEEIFTASFWAGVDLYAVGHEHLAGRIPPLVPFLNPARPARLKVALVDRRHGIPGIFTGTGGAPLFLHPTVNPEIPRTERDLKWKAEDEEILAGVWGIVRLELFQSGYRWEFLPVERRPNVRYPSDSGSCHDDIKSYVAAAANN